METKIEATIKGIGGSLIGNGKSHGRANGNNVEAGAYGDTQVVRV